MPSDVIWTAVITGTVGLGGMLSTGLTSLGLDRRRLDAEDRRLREQHETERRAERGDAYYRAVILLNRLDHYATGYPPNDDAELHATLDEYNQAVSALHLFATADVITALREIQELSRRVGGEMASRLSPGVSHSDAFVAAWGVMRDEIMAAERRMLLSMREDVGPLA